MFTRSKEGCGYGCSDGTSGLGKGCQYCFAHVEGFTYADNGNPLDGILGTDWLDLRVPGHLV